MKPRNTRTSLPFFTRICLMAAFSASAAQAATFTWTGTTAGTYNWAAGTNWDATPASGIDTILSYTGSLAADTAIISNNDIASPPFQLNQLGFTQVGPASGTPPTVTLTGSQLEFISNGGTTPTLTFNTTGTIKPTITINNNLLLTNNLAVAATTDGTLGGVISGTGSLTKSGAGTLTLSGNNTFSGGLGTSGAGPGTIVLKNSSAGGTGQIGWGGATGNAANLKLDNTGTGQNIILTNTLFANGGTLVNVAGDNKLTGQLSVNSGVSNTFYQVDGGTLELAGNYIAGTTLRIVTLTGAGNGLYSGNLTFGANTLAKLGTGTWTLSGANTYSGATNVTGGRLIFAKQSALYNSASANWTPTKISVNSGVTFGIGVGDSASGYFDSTAVYTLLDATHLGLSTTTTGLKSGAIIGFDTSNATGGTFTYGTIITNAGTAASTGLTKLGAGTLKLSGPNSFTGTVAINTGTLAITNSSALGTGSKNVNFASGVTLALDNTGTGSDIVLGSNLNLGANSLAGATIRNVAGNNSIASNLLISFNATNTTLQSDAGSLTLLGNIGMNGYVPARFLLLKGAGTGIISGNISDTSVNLSLTKQDAGTWTLSGTNSYGGATTVSAGTLAVTGSLGATVVDVKNTATLAGTGPLGGSAIVRTGGHQAFAVAATAGTQTPRMITGSLTLEADTVIDLTAAAPPALGGPYVLLTASGGISGSVGSVTFSGVSGSVVKNGNNLELTVTASSGYASWIDTLAFGLAPADKDPTDDPDNDGMDNLLEFVLNGNPSISDNSILPKLVVTATDFEFTYQRRDDSVSPETTETFQWGTTLASWPGSAVIPAASALVGAATITVSPGTPNNAVTHTVKISIPKTEAGVTGKLFGRLQVVKP